MVMPNVSGNPFQCFTFIINNKEITAFAGMKRQSDYSFPDLFGKYIENLMEAVHLNATGRKLITRAW